MLFVTREMENRVANHDVGKLAREGHCFDEADSEILRRQPGIERSSELANVVNSRGVRVDCKHLAAFPKQVNEIPAISATGVENARALVDVSAEDLIEYVDIDLAELVLYGQRRVSVFLFVSVIDPRAR